ncbi:cob(I)yrinic acid a,c-diamide adenosyltransferase [Oceanidesulfovibrio marinus]|uniref:corrinoid adenosyltransferase n=1 Tax=Oceanidesulfovibrio marinus TaxID=370038 RepID=A0A6P1ZF57_9BACT|nr:cob(I)yrinic acid a,c-diamide adenosyltransferase [Oceanidesulfovibrio marinus]QJT11031.1 cob(I)yrinic acid a,c-diamide adenosyltransferase [Oceanidesulfovibrio marinus]TVM31352.1 cob(I)alamin adenolsyltransferase [Oceanidesulfovibrio marinus]
MIIVYTGEGKGKTTAGIGQAVRAIGGGFAVAFGQFLKRPDAAGEQRFLETELGHDFLAGGLGFYRDPADYPKHREAAKAVLQWARERLLPPTPAQEGTGLARRRPVDLIVLDEILYALGSDLVTREEVEELLALSGTIQDKRANPPHIVLTGRGLPDWLAERADLITEMREIKHPAQSGLPAQRCVEM